MQYNIMKKLISSSLALILAFTSASGSIASIASAAPIADEQLESASTSGSVDKSIIGGLLAIGLISVLTNSGSKSGSDAGAPKTSTPTSPATSPSPAYSNSQQSPSASAQNASIQQSSLTVDEKRAFDLMNADRIANGLPALKLNMSVVKVARAHGQDMINRNYFAHENLDGLSPFDRMAAAGIQYGYAGENLAINRSVDLAEKAFMNSPGHRSNILNSKYTEVGIGVRYDASGSVYVVQNFISR